jgi:pimeloyl-ACP methyl ester carboxylesterase
MTLSKKTVFIVIGLFLCQLGWAEEPAWEYQLQPGNHLTYDAVFERQVSSKDTESRSRSRFVNHVIVLGKRDKQLSLGFQRNRQSAELLEFREKGKDRLQHELPDFNQRLAKRGARFSESNEVTITGVPLDYWQATRESQSRLLFVIHEIETLPERAIKIGDTSPGSSLLGVDFHFAAIESIAGEPCNRIETSGVDARIRLQYWFCPGSGVIRRLLFEGDYAVFESTVHEKLTLDLKQKQSGEQLDQWLASPDTRQAALDSLLQSDWVQVSPEQLFSVLTSEDAEAQNRALAVLYQRKLHVSDRAKIQKLAESPNLETKRIASHLLEEPAAPERHWPPDCDPPVEKPYPAQRTGTTLRSVREGENRGWPYIVRVPRDYRPDRPFPLLVYLSGGAGFAMDGVNTGDEVIAPTDYIVLYPQAAEYWWNAGATSHFDATLRDLMGSFNVDANRVYITGFSNGGTGAIYYAELWPQRFAAVSSQMGAGVCNGEVARLLPNLRALPVLLIHGEKDPLIDASCSTQTNETLKGISPLTAPEFHLLKNREHDITLRDDDGLTLNFFGGKVRNPFPARISARVTDSTPGGRYWTELTPKGSGIAEAEGQIKPDGSLELTTKNVRHIRLWLPKDRPGPIRIVINKKEVFQGELKPVCHSTTDASTNPWFSSAVVKEFDVGQ